MFAAQVPRASHLRQNHLQNDCNLLQTLLLYNSIILALFLNAQLPVIFRPWDIAFSSKGKAPDRPGRPSHGREKTRK